MSNYTIGITTFSKRLNYVSKLLEQIRSYTDADILITVNGDHKSSFKEDYRKDILKLCLQYKNIYPIFFLECRGATKLWNTVAIHSKNDLLCILNDDVEITEKDLFDRLESTDADNLNTLVRINNSFSHFVVTKQLLEKLKYFDERFLGFGFEDGDMMYRHIEMLNLETSTWYVHGVKSLISFVCDENVANNSSGKYSYFNQQFLCGKYGPKYIPTDNPKIFSSFDPKMVKVMDDLDQYPYERFFRENKDKL